MPKRKRQRIERKIKRTLLKNLIRRDTNFASDYQTLENLSTSDFTTFHIETFISLAVSSLFANIENQFHMFNFLSQFKLEFSKDIREVIKYFPNIGNKEISQLLYEILHFLLKQKVIYKCY